MLLIHKGLIYSWQCGGGGGAGAPPSTFPTQIRQSDQRWCQQLGLGGADDNVVHCFVCFSGLLRPLASDGGKLNQF